MVAAYFGGLLAQVGRLGLRVGSHPALVCIHQMNRMNYRNECHDDSTINIDIVLLLGRIVYA